MTKALPNPASAPQRSPMLAEQRRAQRVGYMALVIFFGGLATWSAATTITGAVIAPSFFMVEGEVKKVQHDSGGIIKMVHVVEGQRVQAGDLLVTLDSTVQHANLEIIINQIDLLEARSARFTAERDGQPTISFAESLTSRMTVPRVAELVQSEAKLFDTRRIAREGMRLQLTRRIEQIRSEISGLAQQKTAKETEVGLIERELVGVRDLYEKKLVQISRLSVLEREASALQGQIGQMIASTAQAEGKIAETELQILQLDIELRNEATKELRDAQGQLSELKSKRIAAEEQLRRVEVRAPVTGMVNQMLVHTVGGVIQTGEPLMLIVPNEDNFYLEARVMPNDIDQVQLGQQARVRIHAANQRTTPELVATVTTVPQDSIRVQQTGQSYYAIRVKLNAGELERAAPLKIISGMQAETFIQTEPRTPLAYLMKPLADQFARAFRER